MGIMSIDIEPIKFQTETEAQKVRETHWQELEVLSRKYKMTVKELIVAASNDEIDNNDDLFLVFKRSYLLSNQ